MIDPIVFSVAAMVPAAIAIPIALLRDGSSLVKRKPSRIVPWYSTLTPTEALAAAVNCAQRLGYKVAVHVDGCVVVVSPVTFFTWGFFLPVYASVGADGRTQVEIGISSRFFQYGPMVTRAHRNFMRELGEPLKLLPSR